MRQWMCNPSLLCDKHLLGAHVETHMLVGSIAKLTDPLTPPARKGGHKSSLLGLLRKGYIDVRPSWVMTYHGRIEAEMMRRGMKHDSPLYTFELAGTGLPDNCNGMHRQVARDIEDLAERCAHCRTRIYPQG